MIKNVLEYLEKSEAEYPERIAFADENKACTYHELKCKAQSIASKLTQIINPGNPVPVLMDKGVDAVCAFMGTVYAGCFYIFLDTKLPKERIQTILGMLNPAILVTTEQYEELGKELDFFGEIIKIEDCVQIPIEYRKLQDIRLSLSLIHI